MGVKVLGRLVTKPVVLGKVDGGDDGISNSQIGESFWQWCS